MLHHDFQLRHSLHERLDNYGTVSDAASHELNAPSLQHSRTNRGRERQPQFIFPAQLACFFTLGDLLDKLRFTGVYPSPPRYMA